MTLFATNMICALCNITVSYSLLRTLRRQRRTAALADQVTREMLEASLVRLKQIEIEQGRSD